MSKVIAKPFTSWVPVNLGCDPELFIRQGRKTLESSVCIPEEGIYTTGRGSIIRDGVQVELNPLANGCRNIALSHLSHLIHILDEIIPKGSTLDTRQLIKFSKNALKNLSDDAKRFGCGESFNVHTGGVSEIKDDPSVYQYRGAGGHIHLGLQDNLFDKRGDIVKCLDILLGNTCVMIDTDKGNIERRKNYGRAGEHRLPAHGLEYRTLSNFWLRAPQLASFVFGMARFAVNVVALNKHEELYSLVDMKKIEKAINSNDAVLAKRNFNKYKKFIEMYSTDVVFRSGTLSKSNMPLFVKFVKKGIDYWFDKQIVNNWGVPRGFESFLSNRVERDK